MTTFWRVRWSCVIGYSRENGYHYIKAIDKLDAIDKVAQLMDPMKCYQNIKPRYMPIKQPISVKYDMRQISLMNYIAYLMKENATVAGLPDGVDEYEIEIDDDTIDKIIEVVRETTE
jgi:hypothetical protein